MTPALDLPLAELGSGGVFGLLTVLALSMCAFLLWKSSRAKPKQLELVDPRERLHRALGKSRSGFLSGVTKLLSSQLDEQAIGALEQIMLEADIGVRTTEVLIAELKQAYRDGQFNEPSQLVSYLKDLIKARMGGERPGLNYAESGPTVILMVGANGVGKTTSISKLARMLASDNKKVLLAASDTFRAAAVDQLAKWAETLEIEIVRGQQNHKPDAVAYDAADKAKAKDFDVLIVDTAGRLHTKKNLMIELEKIGRVLGKQIAGAPHETLLVIDSNNGQNALQQTEKFSEVTKVTGLFLTKLDGTAKGGIVVRINEELSVPVKFVGLGEKPEDIARFEPETFVEALFS